MRSQYEALTLLRRSAQELDPRRVNETLFELLKAGLPSQSMSDGRGAAETPLTELDDLDANLVATKTAYDAALDALASDAAKLLKSQRELFAASHMRPPAPKSKEFVRSSLKAEADEYDRTHDLEIGTTWAKHQHEAPPTKVDWCISCLRVKGHLSPVADARHGGKDGVLCRWCYDYASQHDGKWPPLDMVTARAEGRPVRVKVKP